MNARGCWRCRRWLERSQRVDAMACRWRRPHETAEVSPPPGRLEPQIAYASVVARQIVKRIQAIEVIYRQRSNRIWRREP